MLVFESACFKLAFSFMAIAKDCWSALLLGVAARAALTRANLAFDRFNCFEIDMTIIVIPPDNSTGSMPVAVSVAQRSKGQPQTIAVRNQLA